MQSVFCQLSWQSASTWTSYLSTIILCWLFPISLLICQNWKYSRPIDVFYSICLERLDECSRMSEFSIILDWRIILWSTRNFCACTTTIGRRMSSGIYDVHMMCSVFLCFECRVCWGEINEQTQNVLDTGYSDWKLRKTIDIKVTLLKSSLIVFNQCLNHTNHHLCIHD